MYLLQVKQISLFRLVHKEWRDRVQVWKEAGSIGPKPKKHEVVSELLHDALAHKECKAKQ